MSLKNVPSGFLKKISFAPQGGFDPKKPFRLKNGLLSLYLRARASDFIIFSQIIAVNDLAKMLKPPYDGGFLKIVGFG